jgi:hypothetical protein
VLGTARHCVVEVVGMVVVVSLSCRHWCRYVLPTGGKCGYLQYLPLDISGRGFRERKEDEDEP